MVELLHADFETSSVSASSDDFSGAVLKLIADLPNCTEEKLFIVAINRELEGARDISLGDLKLLLHKCVQQLAARGLVKIQSGEIVTTEAGTRHLESPAPMPETDQAKEEPEPPADLPQTQADEDGGEAAEAPVVAQPAGEPPKAQVKAAPAQEPVVSIRRTIKDEERALAQAKPTQAKADEDAGRKKSPSDDAAPIPMDVSAPPPIEEEEEILDLTAELGGLEIVEDDEEDDDPAAEIMELADIAPPPDGGGEEPTEDEEVLDLTAELGDADDAGDEDAKYGDHPVVDLKTVRKEPEPVKTEPSPLERAAALFEEEPAPLHTPPQSGRFKETALPQRTRAGADAPSNFAQPEPASRLEPADRPRASGVALTAVGEMTRDIVIASLLVALTAIAAMSGFGGKLSPVLVMLALLLVGSAVWGWRERRR